MGEITLLARLENLERVYKFINQELSHVKCHPSKKLELELALEEVYVNIVRYAYQDEGKIQIKSQLKENPLQITIQFIDQGIPYNPLENKDPERSLKIENKKKGGWGIYLIKKFMDQVDYAYRNGCNILTLQKTL
ncbi:hypothetical protein JCM15415_01080 [Methanobacterium movens]